MRTGWRLVPTCLEDRDDSLNNLIVESHLESMLKMNYAEDLYPDIMEYLRMVQLDPGLYKPIDESSDEDTTKWEKVIVKTRELIDASDHMAGEDDEYLDEDEDDSDD